MRTKAFCRVSLALGILVLGRVARGQVSKPGMGTVTGHVICQDTQKPARFAKVLVFQVPASLTTGPTPDLTDAKVRDAWIKSQNAAINSATFVMAETGIDGRFVAVNVPPGDYYVMASVAGYIPPRNLLQAANDSGQDLSKGFAGVPIVHVSADRSTEGEVTVSRGAAVEGHVMWADGGPVNGAIVSAEPTSGQHKHLPPQFVQVSTGSDSNGPMRITDDRGHYRISGLPPGEYTVRVELQTSDNMVVQRGQMSGGFGVSVLMVYAPSAFHKADAKPMTLTAGEERSDEDVIFKLDGTHSVSGRVTSAEDHHGLGRGAVVLKDANDKMFQRSSGLDADGNFAVTFVPSGTYTISVLGAADLAPTEVKLPGNGMFSDEKVVRNYQTAEQQVIVADIDVTGQNIEVKPVKTSDSDASNDSGGETHVVAGTGR